jgi:hypothetical protein
MARTCLLVYLLLLACYVLTPLNQAQALSQAEIHVIALNAERSFTHIVELWKDQRFDDLYEVGTFASQSDISPEGFSRYMSYATRDLQCCWRMLQDVQTTVDIPERAYIRARLGFKNKEYLVWRGQDRYVARGFAEEETLTFVLQYERQQWRIDLFRILELSGIALEIPAYPVPYWRPY